MQDASALDDFRRTLRGTIRCLECRPRWLWDKVADFEEGLNAANLNRLAREAGLIGADEWIIEEQSVEQRDCSRPDRFLIFHGAAGDAMKVLYWSACGINHDSLNHSVVVKHVIEVLGTWSDAAEQAVAPAASNDPQPTANGQAGEQSEDLDLEFGPGCFFLWGWRVELSGKPREFLERIWNGRHHRLSAASLRDDDSVVDDGTIRTQVSTARKALKAAIRVALPKYDDDPISPVERGRNLAWAIRLPERPS